MESDIGISLANSTHFPSAVSPSICDGDSTLDLREASGTTIARYFYSQEERFIILAFYPATMIFGIVANLLFLLVLFRIPEMRSITNTYLGNLAVADLLVLCSVESHFLISYFLSPKVKTLVYRSSIGCAFNVTVQYASHFTSIALVFLMTVERYLGICKPFQHRVIIANARTVKLIIFAWIFGLAYACAFVAPRSFILVKTCVLWPVSILYDNLPTVLHSRSPLHPFYKNMPPILQMIPFLSALIMNSIMYTLIVIKLHSRALLFDQHDQSTRQMNKVRDNVARLLIANGTVFFLCFIPFYLARFNDSLLALTGSRFGFEMTPSQRGAVDWLAVCLVTINSVINPVIYSVTNHRYRRAFINVFMPGNRRMKATSSGLQTISTTT